MTVAVKEKSKKAVKEATTIKPKKIPEDFIYEIIEGKIFYRKGFRDVVDKRKEIEEIIGSTGLQSYLVGLVLQFLFKNLEGKKYKMLAIELGNNLGLRNNILYAIVIFDRKSILHKLKEVKYVKSPPLVSIEVDVRTDLKNSTEMDYIKKKTDKLLEVGVVKVFWILCQPKLIMVCEKEKDWVLIPFYKSFTVLESIKVNLDQLLREEEKLSEA